MINLKWFKQVEPLRTSVKKHTKCMHSLHMINLNSEYNYNIEM